MPHPAIRNVPSAAMMHLQVLRSCRLAQSGLRRACLFAHRLRMLETDMMTSPAMWKVAAAIRIFRNMVDGKTVDELGQRS